MAGADAERTGYRFEEICRAFALPGRHLEATPHGSGHINDTFLVSRQSGAGVARCLLQRINTNVFRHPERLMQNVRRVTEHLRAKAAAEPGGEGRQEVLELIHTAAGLPFHREGDGSVWRAFHFIERTHIVDSVRDAGQAAEAARAFGRFQRRLSDLPGSRLHDTIPDFHNSPRRYAALLSALERDPLNRAAEARAEIDFALAREALTRLLTDELAARRIPERVTHNDTKINNVLFDDQSGRAVCVIDLDTVMSGAAAYDFGDLVRTMTCPAAEDERNLDEVEVSETLYESVTRGYLEATRGFLTPAEVDALVPGGLVITFETGLRFLTDFLLGDTYFKTQRPGHNLDRARTQLRLVRSLQVHERNLRRIVDRHRA